MDNLEEFKKGLAALDPGGDETLVIGLEDTSRKMAIL